MSIAAIAMIAAATASVDESTHEGFASASPFLYTMVMPNVTFYYSVHDDAKNWLRQFLKYKRNPENTSRYLSSVFDESIFIRLDKIEKNEAIKKLELWLIKKICLNTVDKNREALSKSWKNIEQQFFTALADSTEKTIYTPTFKAALTSFGICPYDPKHDWFMVSMQYETDYQMTTIAHELLHLQFEHYYSCNIHTQKLSEQQYDDLKEALTVILNSNPFSDMLIIPDRGYERHQIVRKKILKLWNQRSGFPQFIKKVAGLITN